MPIPIALDLEMMRADLLRWGWNDYKIEAAVGAAVGYMAKLRNGQIQQPSFGMGARIYNLWEDEALRRSASSTAANTAQIHSFASTLLSA